MTSPDTSGTSNSTPQQLKDYSGEAQSALTSWSAGSVRGPTWRNRHDSDRGRRVPTSSTSMSTRTIRPSSDDNG